MSNTDYKTYTITELAEILKLSTITIRRYIAQGLIKPIHIKIGGRGAVRFSEQEVKRLLGEG
jgi:excisionase family DNA binding protein